MQIQIGKIVNTHGLKGEVRILSNSDFKELRFKVGSTLVVKLKTKELVLKIISHYHHKTFEVVKFSGYENINDVEFLKHHNVYAEELKDSELPEDEFLNSSLLGLNVVDQENTPRGKVIEVIESPADNVLRVEFLDKNFLVPFNKHFINNVNLETQTIEVNVIEGLIDED